jgi:hypothetical protein
MPGAERAESFTDTPDLSRRHAVTDLAVEVEDDTPDAPVDDAPDVVVVDTGGDDAGNDLDIGLALGRVEASLVVVLGRLDELEARTTVAQQEAEVAVDIALDAAAEAVEAGDAAEAAEAEAEEIAAEAEQDMIEPQREHALWRNPLHFGHRDDDQ